MAGCPFTISSPQSVSELLFERLKLPVPPGAKRGGGGTVSTAKEVLEELVDDHPVGGVEVVWKWKWMGWMGKCGERTHACACRWCV